MSDSLTDILKSAWEKRAALVKENPKGAFRLFCGEREGIDGLVVDRYDSVLVFQLFEKKAFLDKEELASFADWYLRHTDAKSVYLKTFVADRSHQSQDPSLFSPTPFRGETAPEKIVVQEGPNQFLIRPYLGYSTGLFMDQRENRRFLAGLSRGKTVLNTFAYTCSFSVACAREEARVTSVDLSSKFLNWGRENFELNSIDDKSHEFFACDIFRYFDGARKRERTFDLIILDPPSFSRGPNGPFSIRKDVNKLLDATLPVLARGGLLFFSSNLDDWSSEDVSEIVSKHFHGQCEFLDLPDFPADFAEQTSPLSQILVRVD